LHGLYGILSSNFSAAIAFADEGEREMLQTLSNGVDSEPWDGRNTAWVYSFLNDDRTRAMNIMLSSDGSERLRWDEGREPGRLRESPFGNTVVTGDTIDSDDAMRLLTSGNATLAECIGRDGAAAGLTLLSDSDGGTQWLLALWVPNVNAGEWAVDASGAGEAQAIVGYSCIRPPREGQPLGDFRLTPLEPEGTHPFQIREFGHEQVAIYARYEASPVERQVNMTLVNPNGDELYPLTLAGGWSCGAGIECGKFAAFEDPISPGEWTVRLRLENASVLDYSLYWCARGLPSDEAADEACEAAGMTDP
jgi:hypothetical protein